MKEHLHRLPCLLASLPPSLLSLSLLLPGRLTGPHPFCIPISPAVSARISRCLPLISCFSGSRAPPAPKRILFAFSSPLLLFSPDSTDPSSPKMAHEQGPQALSPVFLLFLDNLFIYFWLCGILVSAQRLCSCVHVGLVASQHVGSSFPDQKSNRCLQPWEVESEPLDLQGSSSPSLFFEALLHCHLLWEALWTHPAAPSKLILPCNNLYTGPPLLRL